MYNDSRQLKGYQGIFFDEKTMQQLIALQEEGLDSNVENMHITFKFGNTEKYPKELVGREFEVKIIGYASNGRNSGFLVELPDELRDYYRNDGVPHITVSLGEVDGVKGKAVDTAKLDFKPIVNPVKIKGKLGYFIYGKGISMDNSIIDRYERHNITPGDGPSH